MASVFHLCSEAANIKQKVVKEYARFAEDDKKLYFSAVKIQKTWRGYVVRKTIAYWHKCATLIEKYVRGWLVRIHLPELLKAYYNNLCVKFYNEEATKIQALWRGYYVRKYAVSVKDVLSLRAAIANASADMQALMRSLFDQLKAGPWNQTYQCMVKTFEVLFEKHHLLRTQAQEGIFSIHGSQELSCIEKILKSLPFKDYIDEVRRLSRKENVNKDIMEFGYAPRFNLSPRIDHKPHERMLLTQD